MASYTVNFEDGTSHVYDNVPDDIDQQNVQDRASMEFSDKRVTGVTAGAAEATPQHEPGLGTKLAGAAQTAIGVGKDIVTSPLGEMALGGYGAKKYLLDPVLEAMRTRGGVPGPVSPGVAPAAGAPTTFSGGAPNAAAFDQAVSKPYMRPTVPGQPVVGAPQAAGIGQDLAGMAPRATGINAGQALGYSAVLPAALSMPYLGAAQEQAKIRQNPNAPEYANNPYAMVQRGQAPTQGAAGAMNTRATVANQQYGGLSQEDQDRLTQDRLSMAIRLKAAKKVLGQ